jgi:AmmeMemoRadiSam system protein A
MGLYKSVLTGSERKELLLLARSALDSHVKGTAFVEPAPSTTRLKADGASFVTLSDSNGRLRGCIGNIVPMMPLSKSIVMNARSAATHDPRFPPVASEELKSLHVEVTVLSPLEAIQNIAGINIGVHGLYLEKESRSSVFLPQVPVEQGWNLTTYLEQLALKAGLPGDGWKGAKLSTFTAEIIRE